MMKLIHALAFALLLAIAAANPCGTLPSFFLPCAHYGGSGAVCCDGRYAESMRSMCAHPSLKGSKCVNITATDIPSCNDYETRKECEAPAGCSWSDFGCVNKSVTATNFASCNDYNSQKVCEAHGCAWSDFGCVGKDKECKATEYCCPDAKKCLTPTNISCADDASSCTTGQVCCPLTKICVIPGSPCHSPCNSNDQYCCPDALACLTPTNPGTFCTGAASCKSGEVCCSLTKLCVQAGAACTPP